MHTTKGCFSPHLAACLRGNSKVDSTKGSYYVHSLQSTRTADKGFHHFEPLQNVHKDVVFHELVFVLRGL